MAIIQKKICLLGEFAVGKTSLIRRYVEDKFSDKYLSSIGVKVSRKNVELGDDTVKLLIWDLAGGEDYTQSSYLMGAAGALLVCDVTRADTLTVYEFKPVCRSVTDCRSGHSDECVVRTDHEHQ